MRAAPAHAVSGSAQRHCRRRPSIVHTAASSALPGTHLPAVQRRLGRHGEQAGVSQRVEVEVAHHEAGAEVQACRQGRRAGAVGGAQALALRKLRLDSGREGQGVAPQHVVPRDAARPAAGEAGRGARVIGRARRGRYGAYPCACPQRPALSPEGPCAAPHPPGNHAALVVAGPADQVSIPADAHLWQATGQGMGGGTRARDGTGQQRRREDGRMPPQPPPLPPRAHRVACVAEAHGAGHTRHRVLLVDQRPAAGHQGTVVRGKRVVAHLRQAGRAGGGAWGRMGEGVVERRARWGGREACGCVASTSAITLHTTAANRSPAQPTKKTNHPWRPKGIDSDVSLRVPLRQAVGRQLRQRAAQAVP